MTAPVTLAEMIACAKREHAMRQRVYPRQVANGRLKQADADRELARMSAIIDTLQKIAAGDYAALAELRGKMADAAVVTDSFGIRAAAALFGAGDG